MELISAVMNISSRLTNGFISLCLNSSTTSRRMRLADRELTKSYSKVKTPMKASSLSLMEMINVFPKLKKKSKVKLEDMKLKQLVIPTNLSLATKAAAIQAPSSISKRTMLVISLAKRKNAAIEDYDGN